MPEGIATFNVLELSSRRAVARTAGELRAEFDATGVLVFPAFYSDTELAAVRRELDAYFQPLAAAALEKSRERVDLRQFACDIIAWNPVGKGNPAFIELAAHARLHAATAAVIGHGYTAPGSLVMYSVGGGQGQAWHQDCPADDSTAFNLNRLIYTDDITLADGAIVVVPGSHKLGRIPPGGHQDRMEGEVVLAPSAGTLIFLNGHVFHRVTPNLNQKPRVSTNFRAFPAGIPSSVTCVGVYRNGTVNFCERPKMHDGTPAESHDDRRAGQTLR